uniref:Uncharacterized protein n=1 Tax=Pyramimonas obovata TaxID=1411642 RepID=A0A7S0RCR5_9CHLO
MNSPLNGTKKSRTSTPSLAHCTTCCPTGDFEHTLPHRSAYAWRFPAVNDEWSGITRSAALGDTSPDNVPTTVGRSASFSGRIPPGAFSTGNSTHPSGHDEGEAQLKGSSK